MSRSGDELRSGALRRTLASRAAVSASESQAPHSSVIIVTYNSARWIEPCLAALVGQDFQELFEIIVVDNGSTDATVDMIEARFPTVRVIRETNRGFGAGNNVGAREARGRYLAFVNPDTRVERTWLRELVQPLDVPRRVTTSVITLLDDPTRVNTCGNILHFTGCSFVLGYGDAATEWSADREVDGISGAAFAMRKEDFDALGGFDEDFFLYMEDTDLSWRARRAGFHVWLATKSVVAHSYKFDLSAFKIYHIEKGRRMLLRKHLELRDAWMLAPSLVLAEVIAWTWAATLGRAGLKAKWRGTREAKRAKVTIRPGARQGLEAFAHRTMPFAYWKSPAVRALGALANAMFRLNTLHWPRHTRAAQSEGGSDQRAG